MSSLRTRYLVAIAAGCVVAPLALLLQYSAPPPAEMGSVSKAIPKRLGAWAAIAERGPTDLEKEILETDAVITRTYASGDGVECDLSVVFARDNRRVAHPPELCYKGSGWTVEEKKVVELTVEGKPFPVNRLLLVRGGMRLWVYYWYKVGKRCSASYARMQWNIIMSHLAFHGSSSALVRLSAFSPGPGRDATTLAALRRFATVAIPAVLHALP